MMTCRSKCLLIAGIAGLTLSAVFPAGGQTLRYDSHRDLENIPEDVTLRIGSLYSTIEYSQSVGYRYTKTTGPGAKYLEDQELGAQRKDGSEFPLVSTLYFRNYYLVSSTMDVDLTYHLTYKYFPMGTEENDFEAELSDAGMEVTLGDFRMRLVKDSWYAGYSADAYQLYASDKERGFNANLSTDFTLTQYLKGQVYDNPSYRIEYVDSRGLSDLPGGRRYEYFRNVCGLNLDWLLMKDEDLTLTLDRTDTIPKNKNSGSWTNQQSVVYRGTLGYEKQYIPTLLAGVRAGFMAREYPHADRGNQFQQQYEAFTVWEVTPLTVCDLGAGYVRLDLSAQGPYEVDGSVDGVNGHCYLRTQLAKDLWHSLAWTRSLESGYMAGVDFVNEYRYSIFLAPADMNIGFSTAWREVEPELSLVSGYKQWLTQLATSWTVSDPLTLHLSGMYAVRKNEPLHRNGPKGDLAIEWDYNTLTATAGATYTLSKDAAVSAYIQHTSRDSDEANLEFKRETLGLTLTYLYAF